MHQGFWTSITRNGVTALALGVLLTGGNSSGGVLAQAPPVSPPAKQTTEPVFRVPKVAGQTTVSSQSALAASTGIQQQDAEAKQIERVADTRNLSGGTTPNLPKANPNLPKATPAALPSSVTPPPAAPAKALMSSAPAPHPLDRAVDFAEISLKGMQENVMDYTAILAKREEIDGVVGVPTYMNIKIRCPRQLANGTKIPFSIYMKFLRPKDCAGREVIWVEGQNENNLLAHEGSGILRLKTFTLDPTGRLAMNGQKYPIYDAGLENLIVKLIEKADRDRAAGPCTVNYREGAQINKRPCSLIELIHEDRRAPFEFHKAQVFIDDELNLPVRYAAYDWPRSPGADPPLLEEYTYYNVKVNVGLTDLDFSRENPAYQFPNR